MKLIQVILVLAITCVSSLVLGQSKREMPFTSTSPDAKKLLRHAWVAYGDAKFEEAEGYARQALEKDPEFGMAHAFIQSDQAAPQQNLKKALGCKLSPDEKLLIEGLLAAHRHEPVTEYFEPLLKRYPNDYYLNLWMMSNHHDFRRRTEIGETIIKRNPKFAPAYNRLGYAFMQRHDLKIAEMHFNKYLSLRPDLANAYDSKADYLMRVGKIEEAIASYEKAAELGMAVSKKRAELAKAKSKYRGPSENDKQEIGRIIAAVSAAYLKSDIDGILQNFSEQALEFFPSQMVNAGIGNIRTRLKETFSYGSFPKMERQLTSVEGSGPIAVAWGQTVSEFKANSDGKIYEDLNDDIYLFRKQDDGQWKILAHHWVRHNDSVTRPPSDDSLKIREVINSWSFFIEPGEVLTDKHVENYMAIQSSQAVEIFPNQRSNIGNANVRLRAEGFRGIKWAQFTDYNFDVNAFATVGVSRAVAWGIGDHSNYQKGSDKLSQFLYPWAMILTKEKDGQWRILLYHFYA